MKTVRFNYINVRKMHREKAMLLGYFDGVHLGHKKLIETAVKESDIPLGILTFDKPISSLIDNGKSNEVLTSLDDRFKIISKLGVDYYYVVEIDRNFLEKTAEDFIDFLKRMKVTKVYVGSDYRFGKDRKGDIDLLKKYFDTRVIDLVEKNGNKIGAQNIISLLKEGKIKEANELMGHNYMITGYVSHGQGLGAKIGYPTENVTPITDYVFPKFGVYKTIAYIDGVPHLSITNVGLHPTASKIDKPTFEVHLNNYNSYDYGKTISVEFLEFIRPEKKFKDMHELCAQIADDIMKVF